MRRAENTYHFHVLIVLKSRSPNLLEPSGPVQGLFSLLTVQRIAVQITFHITWARSASLQVGSCKIAIGIVRYEYRQNWNIIHFAEQLVLPPIRCFRIHGRFYARSLSQSNKLATISVLLVLSRHTCKYNLIYACKENTSLYLHGFSLNSTYHVQISSWYLYIYMTGSTSVGCYQLWIIGISEINEMK